MIQESALFLPDVMFSTLKCLVFVPSAFKIQRANDQYLFQKSIQHLMFIYILLMDLSDKCLRTQIRVLKII